MDKKLKKYNIGLNIDSKQLGWCVTGEDNQVLSFRGKRMIGTYKFEEGQTTETTRLKRSTRRIIERRKQRLLLLQELISPIVLEKDKSFFIRLQESFLLPESKSMSNKYTLFADSNYTDQDYANDFPSIYHLRAHLMNSTEKADPRFIYLAIHHILKNRGNFLYQASNFNISGSQIESDIESLLHVYANTVGAIEEKEVDVTEIVKVLKNTNIHKSVKKKLLIASLPMDKKQATEIAAAIIGNNFNLAKLFKSDELSQYENVTVSFSSDKWEEASAQWEDILGERYEVVEALEKIYNQYVLSDILGSAKSLSEAMIYKYDKHGEELTLLKDLFYKYAREQFTPFFRLETNEKGDTLKNYANYIKGDKACTLTQMYDTLKKIFKDVKDEKWEICLQEIEEENFLKRLRVKENRVIPYQLNKLELEKIIENQERYYPILKENKEKIIQLLTFRIPYYVGPLNPNSRFSWVVKNSNAKIYPWNFFDVINQEKTAEAFINNLIGHCTYLPDKFVIPSESLLYSKFKVLNELSNIRVNGKPLTGQFKKKAYHELFELAAGNVTMNKFLNWYKAEAGAAHVEITGFAGERGFNSRLNSYHQFKHIFGEIHEDNKDMIEMLIYWLTVYEETSIIEKLIDTHYTLTHAQKKAVLRLKFKGWSKLSKELLVGLTSETSGKKRNIMYYLENTSRNFVQIITDKDLAFYKTIEYYQDTLKGKKIELEDVQKLYASPAVKKGVWQGIKLIEEIIKIMGHEPKNIMIEFERKSEDKQQSIRRSKKLKEALTVYNKAYPGQIDKAIMDDLKNNEKQLDNEKLYLYFLQAGKCLCTGTNIDINHLERYTVAHIIPPYYIKDDSIENKMLVVTGSDKRKEDNLLLDSKIQDTHKFRWFQLKEHELMGQKKLNNLLRVGFDEKDERYMINRQIVEKKQVIKSIATLLQNSYTNTSVVAVRHELVQAFRSKHKLLRVSHINDSTAAQDAFITALIGNVLLLNKECDSSEWIYGEYIKYKRSFDKSSHNFIMGMFNRPLFDTCDHLIWQGKPSLEKALKVFKYKNYIITKKLEENTGQFYKETIFPASETAKLIPIKEHLDPAKYGGYSSVSYAYSTLIEHTKNKKRVKELIGIPVQISYYIKQGKLTLEEYLSRDYDQVIILKSRVLKHQLIEEDGQRLTIASPSELTNATQLYLDDETIEVLDWIKRDKQDVIKENSTRLIKAYNNYLNKAKEHYPIFENIWNSLIANVDFEALEIEEQCKLLFELLKVTKADAQRSELKKINSKLPAAAGRISRSPNFKKNYIVFIDTSITGLFEKRYGF